MKQWNNWVEGSKTFNLPAQHFVRSAKSATALQEEGFSLPEYSVSTAALLMLLCRWSSTMTGASRAKAKWAMTAMIQRFLGNKKFQ
eukprot:9577749-Lingulodinium_polyedra.AAC.1